MKNILPSFGGTVQKTLFALGLTLTLQTANAVILFGSGDPSYNTSPPSGTLANSGWQYEGY